MNNKDAFIKLLGVYGLVLSLKGTQTKIKEIDKEEQSECIITIQTSDLAESLEWNLGCTRCKTDD